MQKMNGSHEVSIDEDGYSEFAVVTSHASETPTHPAGAFCGGATVACLHGFELNDKPVISGLPQFPGELVVARTTVRLTQEMVGEKLLVVFENADPGLPIVVGVLNPSKFANRGGTSRQFSVEADDERFVVDAEREIVLRCGDASITLTRAGKVIIQGNYVLSRSKGYNKIKGAAIDLN